MNCQNVVTAIQCWDLEVCKGAAQRRVQDVAEKVAGKGIILTV